jgi:hypothetical protein
VPAPTEPVPKAELLAAVRAAGFLVTDAQLARWHRAGLLERPRVRSLGRGLGTQTLYGPNSVARLIRIAEIHEHEHRLRDVAWRLWWEDGGAISAPAREYLEAVAENLDRQRKEVLSLVERDAVGNEQAAGQMDELFRSMERDRLGWPLGEARRRVGVRRFPIVGRIMLELVSSRFDGFDTDPETGASDEDVLVSAFGLDRARTDKLATAEPWLEGGLGADFARLAHLIASTSFAQLARTADPELDAARGQFREFTTTVTTAARMLQTIFGQDAFGYGMLGRLFQLERPHDQAQGLLGWMSLRTDEGLHEGMRELAGLSRQAQATEKLYEVAEEIRREVPALRELLSPARLGAAQRDADEGVRLRSEIASAADEHRSQVDAVLSRHRDLAQLQRLASGEAGASVD